MSVRVVSLHVQALLGLGGLILGAVADHGITVRQVEVECDQGAMLHAQGPQSGTINLECKRKQKGKIMCYNNMSLLVLYCYLPFNSLTHCPFSIILFFLLCIF